MSQPWKVFLPYVIRFARDVPRLINSNLQVRGAAGQAKLARLYDRLPRGTHMIRAVINRKEEARWAYPSEIVAHAFKPGDVMLGRYMGVFIGDGGDKPIITCASARSGKTTTVLKPSLFTYRGSMVVLDPKGELARDTAEHRAAKLGQKVYVHDPSLCSGLASSAFNPLAEIDPLDERVVSEIDEIANTLVVEEGGGDNSFWVNSARMTVRGLIGYALTLPEEERSLVTVRQLADLSYRPLLQVAERLRGEGRGKAQEIAQRTLFAAMAAEESRFGGMLAGVGNTLLAMEDRVLSNVMATVRTELKFLSSITLQKAASESSFRMTELVDAPTTIYICMSPSDMEEQFRWLRVLVRQALSALERRRIARGTDWPLDKPRILFLMEEFPILRSMPIMEQAAAYFPSTGARLWAVVQDLPQIQRWYPKSWESFMGNAGVLQFFANGDLTTQQYVSDRLGSLSFIRGRFQGVARDSKDEDYVDKERLLYAHEVEHAFAKDGWGQLLMFQGENPVCIPRLTHDEVADLQYGGEDWATGR